MDDMKLMGFLIGIGIMIGTVVGAVIGERFRDRDRHYDRHDRRSSDRCGASSIEQAAELTRPAQTSNSGPHSGQFLLLDAELDEHGAPMGIFLDNELIFDTPAHIITAQA